MAKVIIPWEDRIETDSVYRVSAIREILVKVDTDVGPCTMRFTAEAGRTIFRSFSRQSGNRVQISCPYNSATIQEDEDGSV